MRFSAVAAEQSATILTTGGDTVVSPAVPNYPPRGVFPPYPQPVPASGSTPFADYFFNPPAGSDWYKVLQAWDGQPESTINVVLSNNVVLQGWVAKCAATVTIHGNSHDDIVQVGDYIGPGETQYPYCLNLVENSAETMWIMPINSAGNVGGHSAQGLSQNAGADLAAAIDAIAAGGIVASAVVAGGTAADAAATSADTAVSAPSIGISAGDASTTLPTLTASDLTPIATSSDITDVTGSLGDADLTASDIASSITDLPDEFQPTTSLPDDTYTGVPSDVMATAPDVTASDILSTLPATDAAALAASAGGISIPSIPGIPGAGSLISALTGAASATGTTDPGSNSTGQTGETGTANGAIFWIGLAAAAAWLLTSKGK